MYTLKSIARRGSLGALAAVFAVAGVPLVAFADSLNPLTERSLLLSSSAPGFQDTDGSGNSEGQLNAAGEQYAPPGSGANGKKSGETFSFRVSTDSAADSTPIKAITMQYCTKAAGLCRGPGNDYAASTPGVDDESHSDLNVNYTAPVEGTDFDVLWDDDGDDQTPMVASTGWTMTPSNDEADATDWTNAGGLNGVTGKNNYITLSNATSTLSPDFNGKIQVVFNASSTNYITNPGDGSFFVKMNTYSDAAASTILDGGVTVANMMTDSIHITTKVLETMAFSVGTKNRDTEVLVDPAVHGPCDPIQVVNNNRLDLGDPTAEYSLDTSKAYDTYSYWRLSSNSSGGATVYYSGDTLRNTVGDEIDAIGPNANLSTPGKNQFGLAFVGASEGDTLDTALTDLYDADPTNPFKTPHTTPLVQEPEYTNGSGTIGDAGNAATASFAFDDTSITSPAVIAQENTDVLSCSTAKMRYVANIGADTPAGVYTTKVNYLAAPQY